MESPRTEGIFYQRRDAVCVYTVLAYAIASENDRGAGYHGATITTPVRS